MGSLFTLLTILTAIGGIVLTGSALNSRSDLERVFFTHEQKTKAYFYNLLILSGLFSFSITFLTLLFESSIAKGKGIPDEILTLAVYSWIGLFIFFMIFLGFIVDLIDNLFIKHPYKYKVSIPELGEVYILSMLNDEICICSADANINLKASDQESVFIEKNTIIKHPLVKEKILKPEKSFLRKLID
ncbi:hypothetical protein [Planomicrobium sp. Y74]|uniref:hypothetical protein n=1 Tax=Planomicrobium sp. Y74 TaxID=2478977 RepID=UPI000EF4DEF4|nr:hypothetical protein [Planomicrobium sp. Y74]RLQ84915.1 hypothetical protein D9754_16750 [Planomicrobium sp. Y74]